MSDTVLIFIPLLLFFLVLVFTMLWTERTRSRQFEAGRAFSGEYFLGSRSLSGFVLAMTLIATYGSVSSFVSGPGIAWKLGLGWVVFAAPQIIAGFFILGLLGKKMALVSRACGAITVTGLIDKRFGSRALSIILSIALLLFFTAMMTGQFIGGAAIFPRLPAFRRKPVSFSSARLRFSIPPSAASGRLPGPIWSARF